jgi:hypothetical protein
MLAKSISLVDAGERIRFADPVSASGCPSGRSGFLAGGYL